MDFFDDSLYVLRITFKLSTGEAAGVMVSGIKQRKILYLPFAIQHAFHLGIARYAGEHGWHLNADMATSGKIPYGWRGDGIVTMLTDDDLAERVLQQFGLPVVDLTINRPDLPVARVTKDNLQIGRLGARHFLDRGWRHFAFFSRANNNVVRLRLKGFCGEVEREKLQCAPLIWPMHNPGRDAAWDHVGQWLVEELAKLPKPVALMAYRDHDAALAMDACLGAGMAIPDEVGILGVENMEEVCPCLPVPLSSVNTDAATVGYQAAALLNRLLDGAPAPAAPILIPPGGVVQRASTDRLVIHSPRLRRVIELIDERIQDLFSMEQIAEAAGVSRQGLYKLFERELRQTPAEYVLRKRMSLARELLAGTDESLTSVARRCGMPTPSTFIRQFTQQTGMTPGAWRRSARSHSKT